MCACCQPADAQKVGEPFVDPSLHESQATTGKPEYGGRKRVALDLALKRHKHLLRRGQLTLLEQRASEDAGVEDAKERRSP